MQHLRLVKILFIPVGVLTEHTSWQSQNVAAQE